MGVGAVWVRVFVQPGSLIHARGIDYKCGVVFPGAYGVAVEPRVWIAPGVHLGRKLPPVRPNIAPDSLLSIENGHAIRNWFKPHLPSKTYCLGEKITGKTEWIADLVRVVSAPRLVQRFGFMQLECSFA